MNPKFNSQVSVLEEIVEVVDFRGQCHQKSGHCGCEGSSGDITQDGTLLWPMTVRNQHYFLKGGMLLHCLEQ